MQQVSAVTGAWHVSQQSLRLIREMMKNLSRFESMMSYRYQESNYVDGCMFT